MPSPSPRRPVSAGPPSARDAAQLGRQLPQIPPLDRFVAAQGTSNAYNERRGASGIRRAFLLDVVAERDEEGQLSREAECILHLLGDPLNNSVYRENAEAGPSSRPRQGSTARDRPVPTTPTKAAKLDKSRMASLVKELQETEKRYLKRITCLKTSYADPLRKFAKRPETMIIPVYDAKVMFANIDAVVTAAESFCADLQDVDLSGRARDRNIGDVCLHHLKTLRTFDCYRGYYDRQDESQRSFQMMLKRHSFETFTETVKYQTSGIGNIGIRELLAEPVQRIPRYTLLWQGIIDCLHVHDVQRLKLEECIEIASKIALCETDERTKRATVMYCLERTVEGFPANLISNNRDYIDCIDADDIPIERRSHRPSLHPSVSNPSLSSSIATSSGRPLSPTATPGTGASLNCSLFLFDDKLVLAKRQHPTISGAKVTGLDDMNKLMRGGGGLIGLAQSGAQLTKDKLSFRGIVDILDVVAVDTGGGDFQLLFEKEIDGQGDRWSGRPLRSYTAVHPPLPAHTDASQERKSKLRFVQNLWAAQALMRTKVTASAPKGSAHSQGIGLPKAMKAASESIWNHDQPSDQSVILYCNIWNRYSWIGSDCKAKVVLQITSPTGSSPLPLGDHVNPTMVIRLEPQRDGICGLSVSSSQVGEIERENDVVDMEDVADQILQIVHEAGLQNFQVASISSQPNTPTTHRIRPSMMNLDTISRNLFGNQSLGSRSRSTISHSTVSRSSTIDTSRFSVETKSTTATSLEEHYPAMPQSPNKPISPGRKRSSGSDMQSILEPPLALINVDGIGNDSDTDLNARLDLAKANSVNTNQLITHNHAITELGTVKADDERDRSLPRVPLHIRNRTPTPTKQDITESQPEDPPIMSPVRPLNISRVKTPPPSRSMIPVRSPRPLSIVSEGAPSISTSVLPGVSNGLNGRPLGPRQPTIRQDRSIAPVGTSRGGRIVSGGGRRVSAGREKIPLKESPIELEESPTSPLMHKRARSTEELVPRKRSYDLKVLPQETGRGNEDGTPDAISAETTRDLPWPPDASHLQMNGGVPALMVIDPTPMERQSDVFWDNQSTTTDEIQRAIATAKRIKSEIEHLGTTVGKEMASRHRHKRIDEPSPGLIRSPPSRKLSKHVVGDSEGSNGSLSSRRTPVPTLHGKGDLDIGFVQNWSTNASGLIEQMIEALARAESDKRQLTEEVETYHQQAISSSLEVNSLQGRLARAAAKHDLAKTSINDLTAELETVYDAFNVELDGMFNDAHLPPTEAFDALRRELQATKTKRNELHLENIRLRRELQESNAKKEELVRLLRAHGST